MRCIREPACETAPPLSKFRLASGIKQAVKANDYLDRGQVRRIAIGNGYVDFLLWWGTSRVDPKEWITARLNVVVTEKGRFLRLGDCDQ